MSGSGFGAEGGYNDPGGGIPSVDGLVPQPGELLPGDGFIRFVVGSGVLVSLSTLRITSGGEIAYDGAIGTFTSPFSSSTLVTNGDGSFSLAVKRTAAYLPRTVTVVVEGSSVFGVPLYASWTVTISPLTEYPPVPSGLELGRFPISRATGEVAAGILPGAAGLVFASPALLVPSTGEEVDVDSVEIVADAGDKYLVDRGTNPRPFLWGPPPAAPPARVFPPNFSPPDYSPSWNDPAYALVRTKPHAAGTLAATKVVSSAANSAGLVLITTSTPHGYSTGDTVRVEHVNGTVEANGTWTVTVTGASTFTLDGSAFVNAFLPSTPPDVAHAFRPGLDGVVILY
jgi:hypothetical protein